MLTVKVISQYPCAITGHPEIDDYIHNVTKTRIFAAESVDCDTMNGDWIVTCDKDTFYSVPFFHKPTDWETDEGVTIAVYVENERGKTIHSVRSNLVEQGGSIPLGIDDGVGPVKIPNRIK